MRRAQQRAWDWLRHTEGTSAVEFAIILPVFLVLVCGVMDFGNLYYQTHLVNEAARAGARTASVEQTLANAYKDVGTVVHKFDSTLSYTVTPNPPVSGSDVKVAVKKTITYVTPMIREFLPASFNSVTGTSVMRVE